MTLLDLSAGCSPCGRKPEPLHRQPPGRVSREGGVIDRSRRAWVGAALLAGLPRAAGAADVADLLRQGSVVIALRHALAPGTLDPPQFRVDDCRTQRNLSEEGRAQARRIGAWFEARGLRPSRVRTSPWCRCVDTARLAFGQADTWAALGSPHGAAEATNAASLAALRAALAEVARQPGRFEAWVTHMFVLNDLAAASTASGEGLVLRAGPDGQVAVLARLTAP